MKRLSAILFLFSCLSLGCYAQSLDQAKKLYNEGNYEEAKPAFERLVKQSPNNSSYNLWYGVCCFETGDIETAEKHLLVANKRKVAESYSYLAKIYTQMYRFDEAAGMWEDYIALMEKKKENTEEFEKELARVEKMQRLLNNTEDVQVIDSIVVDKDHILSTYYLSEDCGILDTYAHFFGTSEQITTTVHINPKGDQAYYARPSGFDQFKLYSQSKLLNTWSDERPLFSTDDGSDNNYPFMLGDGVTLYFASKGNGSIGGYDLFVTRYNTNTDAYLAPEQMGMPFNSPANDYLMVIDETKGVGWFVSDRYQPEGKVCVYLFIPDESRKRIEQTDDEEWLRRRAALTSINETWVSGSNYAEDIRLARTDLSSTKQQIEKDFEFVINDQTIYHTWKEFRSSEAKSFYEKVVGLDKQIETLEKRLDETRESYAKGNASVHAQLKPTILNAEEELNKLYAERKNWTKKARNTENVYLKN
ncbi:MAG: tetratricopeptide repeat protein [Tannerella sp.]|jgi:tetratricopeptide (TPR) repeat protein|nr:tetratricopeptide repeat protein [Tannerella sp.]